MMASTRAAMPDTLRASSATYASTAARSAADIRWEFAAPFLFMSSGWPLACLVTMNAQCNGDATAVQLGFVPVGA